MSNWFRNGEQLGGVPVDDRAFHYGDGLFETVAIRNGQPRLWDMHLRRLRKGCNVLRMEMPDPDGLLNSLSAALSDVSLDSHDCTVKLLVSAGPSERGYARRVPTRAEVYIGVFAAAPIAQQAYRDGVDTIICDTKLAVNSVTAGCKTLNRIEQVLARTECLESGVFEGFTLDAEGRLICGTMSNVFTVSDNLITTPSLERCGVEGVMRQFVLDTLRQGGREVSVRDMEQSELLAADEVFLSNSQFGVVPVRRCGEKHWGQQRVTQSVMSVLGGNGIRECIR